MKLLFGFLAFSAILIVACAAAILVIYALGATWATLDWGVCFLYCKARGREPPTWWSRFMALDGGNQ